MSYGLHSDILYIMWFCILQKLLCILQLCLFHTMLCIDPVVLYFRLFGVYF